VIFQHFLCKIVACFKRLLSAQKGVFSRGSAGAQAQAIVQCPPVFYLLSGREMNGETHTCGLSSISLVPSGMHMRRLTFQTLGPATY
jgi:hypothetical protein